MRNLFYLLLGFTLAVSLTSCSDDDTDNATMIQLSSADNIVVISESGMSADVTFPAGGATANINVTSNISWELSSNAANSWATFTREGNDIKVVAPAFVSDDTRKEVIYLENGSVKLATIRIEQKGTLVPYITFDTDLAEIPYEGTEITVEIDTNIDNITVTKGEGSDWFTMDREGTTLTLSAEPNDTESIRRGSIKVTGASNTVANLTVIQWTEEGPTAGESFLKIERTVTTVDWQGNGTTEVPFYSDYAEVTAQSLGTWLSAEVEGGNIVLSGTANNNGEPRQNTVRVTAGTGSNAVTQTITVYQFYDPMILEFTVDQISQAGAYRAIVPFASYDGSPDDAREVNLFIDWGDGTVDRHQRQIAYNTPTDYAGHDYATTGTYTVQISGSAPYLRFGNLNADDALTAQRGYVTALKAWGNISGITSAQYGFTNTKIKSVPLNTGNMFQYTNNFEGIFQDCSELTEIEPFFGTGIETIDAMGFMFTGTGLDGFPFSVFDQLADTRVTSLGNLFVGFGLTEIPAGFMANFPHVTSVNSLFSDMAELSELPTGLFANNTELTDISSLFKNCSSLTTIPGDIFANCDKLTNASYAFQDCSSLTAIPGSLFQDSPLLNNLTYAFYGCGELTEIPNELFDNNPAITRMPHTFANCTKLTGETPFTMVDVEGVETKVKLWERKALYPTYFEAYPGLGTMIEYQAYDRCFLDCLGLDDYGSMPSDWKVW